MPKRICLFCNRFYPLHDGAATQALHVSELILRSDASFHITVVTQRFAGLAAHELLGQIQVYRLGPVRMTDRHPRLSFSFFLAATALFLIRHRRDFDLWHSLTSYALGSLIATLGRVMSIPTILKIAGGELTKPSSLKKQFLWAIRRTLLSQATALVCLNAEVESALLAAGIPQNRIYRISNAVDVATFVPPADHNEKDRYPSQCGLKTTGTIVIFVGYIHPRKGLAYLLQAWRQISARFPDAYLLLIGPELTGQAAAPLAFTQMFHEFMEREASDLRVGWLGSQNHVEHYLRAGDLFVLPSLAEGLPNALLEAMAAGLPCLATDLAGTREIITPEVNGLLVPPADSDALASGLNRLLTLDANTYDKIAQQARETILERYSLAATSAAYIWLYQRLIASTGSSVSEATPFQD